MTTFSTYLVRVSVESYWQGIGVSIIRGTGRQTVGAVILFVSYYVIALPVGVSLMFATSLRLTGLSSPLLAVSAV